jgi:hypothetical protein
MQKYLCIHTLGAHQARRLHPDQRARGKKNNRFHKFHIDEVSQQAETERIN